jgi:hypothetical protein
MECDVPLTRVNDRFDGAGLVVRQKDRLMIRCERPRTDPSLKYRDESSFADGDVPVRRLEALR